MFNTPTVGQPVQYLPRQGSEPFAAIILLIDGTGPSGRVDLAVLPPWGTPEFEAGACQNVPHVDANGPKPVYPCWREAK